MTTNNASKAAIGAGGDAMAMDAHGLPAAAELDRTKGCRHGIAGYCTRCSAETVSSEAPPPRADRDLHSHMMVVATRAAAGKGSKELLRAVCRAIADDKNLRAKLADGMTAFDPAEEARRTALADVDPVVLQVWKLQGRTVGAMLREAQAAVIELQDKMDNSSDGVEPAVADPETKAAYVAAFGSDKGWLSVEGSYFIEGYREGQRSPAAGAQAPSSARLLTADEPLDRPAVTEVDRGQS